MRKSGYYWVKSHSEEEIIAFYTSEDKSWALPGSDVCLTDDQLMAIDERRVYEGAKDGNWKPANEPPLIEKKGVIVWAEGNSATGYGLGYIEKNSDGSYTWWEVNATINSSPMNVLFWQELPPIPKIN